MAKAKIYHLADYRDACNPLSMELIAKLERQLVEAGLIENSGNLKRNQELQSDCLGAMWNDGAADDAQD